MLDKIQESAFKTTDPLGVPMAMMRIGERDAILDAMEKFVHSWMFQGSSMPNQLCRCLLKIKVYNTPSSTGTKVASGIAGIKSKIHQ